jgi:hypothetical protein
MKSNIQELLIEFQIKHYQDEIESMEMLLKDTDYDTVMLLTISSTHEVELVEAESLQERLEIYKSWYQQILYIFNKFLQDDEYVDDDWLIAGVDY